jgi:hypothetical protein
MGTHNGRERQEDLWVAHTDIAVGPGHTFYVRLNEVLDGVGFDPFVEKLCSKLYADKVGCPGLSPGIYFRSLMISYFEGIESERGIGLAAEGLAESAALFGRCVGRGYARSLHHFPHAPIDRLGDAPAGIFLGSRVACRSRLAGRQAHRHRCDHAVGRRGDALDRAARHGREL